MNSKEHGPINLGNPNEMTVKELAEKIISLTKSKSKINNLELPIDDPKIRRPDISKAKYLIGFNPEIGLVQGLKETIGYFKIGRE
jgi:nucleoside-diphosphate-sugar epimerase